MAKAKRAKAQKPQSIQVDIASMDLDDYYMLLKANKVGRFDMSQEMLEFLDRVVVGGILGKHYPLSVLNDVVAALTKQTNEAANPADESGKA